MIGARPLRALALVATTLALGACASAADRTAEAYQTYQAYAAKNGLLRRDYAPADAPYSNDDLLRNFERVALYQEFTRVNGRLIARPTRADLTRWESPIRYWLGGEALEPGDERVFAALAGRVEGLTGLSIDPATSEADANVVIYVMAAAERARFSDFLDRRGLGEAMALARIWVEDDNYPCIGTLLSRRNGDGDIGRALILVRAETTGVLRESCFHEEFVQSLGLANDDPDARPSIFNDDEEFALLTEHDEYLLRILYDPRLRPGMNAGEALPIVRQIIEDIRPEGDAGV